MIGTSTLEIKDLTVTYRSPGFDIPVLRNINLHIKQNQVYGLVGETGSGKSTLGLTIMRHLPQEGSIKQGKIFLSSKDLLALPVNDLPGLWGKEISYVPQDPNSSLNPSMKISDQISEVLLAHSKMGKKEANEKTLEWLSHVRITDPETAARKYPHELSGGQKQRILFAMALCNHPNFLVLDEPTSSLDVTTEFTILQLMQDLIQEEKTSALLITHNLGIVDKVTDRVAVLYAGELIEDAPTSNIIHNAIHPYTQGLIYSIPRMGLFKDMHTLFEIPGRAPTINEQSQGCVFASRCPFVLDRCRNEHPPMEMIDEESSVRCFRWREIKQGMLGLSNTTKKSDNQYLKTEIKTLLDVENLRVAYDSRSIGFQQILGNKNKFNAVKDASFKIGEGQTLGIVGESGSGKTSLALAVMGLIGQATGKMDLFEFQLPMQVGKRNKQILRNLQMVFQDLDGSFPPYSNVEEILLRPLLNLAGMRHEHASKRVKELLSQVHLPEYYLLKYPRQLSGGEKQRLALARALTVNPALVIADEPVSSLDVSVQAGILNLLNNIQQKNQTSLLLISHNITIVAYLADEIIVMYLGHVMQYGTSKQVFSPPFHPYTETLLFPDALSIKERSPHNPTQEFGSLTPLEDFKGCPFYSQCPRALGKLCEEDVPPRQSTADGGFIFCHIPLEELIASQKETFHMGED